MKKYLVFIFCLIASITFSQKESNVKFGKISPEDFNKKVYELDSNANAMIIADIGSTEIVGNYKGRFSLEFKRFKRVHILNKNGYEIANVQIGIYTNGSSEEDLQRLKAVTYNLEDGKVVETKLDIKANVFKDVINKNYVVKKFTFPNIKVGSIIEFEYKLVSDFVFNFQPWDFQGNYPCLWSEYNVSIPEFYYYAKLSHGYQQFYINDKSERTGTFVVSDINGTDPAQRTNITAGVSDYRWVMKDVPALKEENFTSTLKNHLASIEFQLSEIRYPLTYKNIMGTWEDMCKSLLEDEDFGKTLKSGNGWLEDVNAEAIKSAKTNYDKAKNIYSYVRDNFTCTNHNRKYLEKSLKTIYKNKTGSEAEINLLLVAMLKKAGFTADPVLLGTRSHGYVFSMYPLIERMNYVIAHVIIDNVDYYLDASEPRMGFGKLGSNLYNGHARIINEFATPIEFNADSLNETKLTSIFIFNGEKKGELQCTTKQSLGYYESYRIRDKIKTDGKEKLVADIKKAFNADINISDFTIDSLNNYEQPLSINYKFTLANENEDIIYFSPMFGEGYKENPFKANERLYPVEMPYAFDETYVLNLEVPTGYVIDELPKQTRVKLNAEGDGIFEYRVVAQSNGTIMLQSKVKLKKAIFQAEEYENLRQFFNFIVKKQTEQIVFKKKS